MRTCVLTIGFFLIASCALAADIDGKWTGEYKSGGMVEPITVTFEFKAEGDKLTGTDTASIDGKAFEIKEGKIDGKNISFKVEKDYQGMALKLSYKGVLKDDEIKMTLEMEGAQEFTVKRVKKSSE